MGRCLPVAGGQRLGSHMIMCIIFKMVVVVVVPMMKNKKMRLNN